MKVVACVKVVPDGLAGLRIDPATLRLDRSGDGTISQDDLHAVEQALRVVERRGGEVTLLSVTGSGGHKALRRGLALGAARAVAVTDDRVAGSDLVATSRMLAAALQLEEPDLALFGQAASDSNGGLLCAAVAERLGWAAVAQAGTLTVEASGITATRQVEDGWEVLRAPLPAAVALTDNVNSVRGTPLAAVLAARAKPVDVLTLDDLGVAPDEVGAVGSCTDVLGLDPPAQSGPHRRLEGDAEEAAHALVAALGAEGYV